MPGTVHRSVYSWTSTTFTTSLSNEINHIPHSCCNHFKMFSNNASKHLIRLQLPRECDLHWCGKLKGVTVYFSRHQPHCHSSIKAIFMPHESLLHSLHTPPPLPPHHLYLSPPLCNCLHTVQGAHGLDGKPGPVVSGTRPVPLTPSPLISLLLLLSFCFYSLPATCYVSEYIQYVSVCLPLFLCLFSILPIG